MAAEKTAPTASRKKTVKRIRHPAAAGCLPEEVRTLVHSLQVHQIELEMQNEELRRTQLELETVRDRYADLYDFAPVGYLTLGSTGLILEANLAAVALLGTERGRLIRRSLGAWIVPADQDGYYSFCRKLRADPLRESLELTIRRTDGSLLPARLDALSVRGPDGKAFIRLAVLDLSERRLAESRLAGMLEEKATLLREVHHRVKNNLQAIVSLAQMKAGAAAEPAAALPLLELMGQVRAMAMVYERLFLAPNVAHIEMASYLKPLVEFVTQAFGSDRPIKLDFQLQEVTLDIERALPCGMLVNELVTNSLKYAFPSGFGGRLTIRIALGKVDDTLHLTVADNGIGLPSNISVEKTRSFGLRLSNLWVTHQLGGAWEHSGPPGLAYHITFPTTTPESI